VGAKGLTPPAYALSRLDADAAWERLRVLQNPLGETYLTIALYRRSGAGGEIAQVG
jgi:hypothetical protein